MPNILYITYDGLTDNLGQSQVIPYLEGLSALDYSIYIVSFEKRVHFKKRKATIEKQLKSKNIVWHPLFYTKFPPVLSTVYDILILLRKVKRLQKDNAFDLVHCRSYIAAFGGLQLKQKYGVQFIFDMRGFYPDERVDGKVWNLNNPVFKRIYKFFKRQENRYLKNADYTISLTNSGKKIILEMANLQSEVGPVEVIPCCADLDHFKQSTFQEEKSNTLRKLLDLPQDAFVLSYLGSIGTWYMLEEMLDFFKLLLQKKPHAKFLFISSESEAYIYSEAKKRQISADSIIVRQAERSDVPAYIALSQLSIFFILPVFSKKASSPTKMAEIMGMGVPIVCNANVGDVETIVQDTESGLIVYDFNSEEYLRVIDQLDDLLKTDPQKIRKAAIKYFSLKDGVEKYHQIYQTLLNSGTN